MAEIEPRCYECLTADVAVKVIGPYGLEIWLCAEDWQAQQDFAAMLDTMFADAISRD